jgi:leucyl-tRNA synthetase
MTKGYPFKNIEEKWQAAWESQGAFLCPDHPGQKQPYYCLVMFPYPSGKLHMGHVRNYTIGDVLARTKRTRGFEVLHPIGWDAFGLPAENAAIERGIDPERWTRENIRQMTVQLKRLGISYDWSREFATCDVGYYRWNQWIFLKMFEKGLAYRKEAAVNWCPQCATVLANEQVHEGACWRCSSPVQEKKLAQWFFKITAYAEELLEDHRFLEGGWPPEVLQMQKNWIGKSWGATVEFPVASGQASISVFTTRPDTLFGATFVVLAPEHPMVESLTDPSVRTPVRTYQEKARRTRRQERTDASREKTGEFLGTYALNPVNGKKIPIWIADYVLTDYGTGAIMAVPAHDQRDFDFARAHGLDIVPVIKPLGSAAPADRAYEGDGVMTNSGRFDALPVEEAKREITRWLETQAKAKETTTYKLRDWLISRQRYWGTPIPIIFCDSCGIVPVSETDLPVELPQGVPFTGKGESPLAQEARFLNTTCPRCKKTARRETDTMDTFVDSSWYHARYIDPKNAAQCFDPAKVKSWLPVSQYVGGIEHACMHLIYARFFHKVLRDLGLVGTPEPFGALLTQGMVTLGGSAMSKSKGNVVEPSHVIERFGADTARLFILFAAPPSKQLDWSEEGVEGMWRFLNRVWRLYEKTIEGSKNTSGPDAKSLLRKAHQTIQRVTSDIDKDFGFNTALAAIMELVNVLTAAPDTKDPSYTFALETTVRLLSPFAPHLCDELWSLLGHKDSLTAAGWPVHDPAILVEDKVEIVIQIDGKLKGRITVSAQATEKDVVEMALAQVAKEKNGGPATLEHAIYIPQKLVNIVTKKHSGGA